jgi:hypothetical protein
VTKHDATLVPFGKLLYKLSTSYQRYASSYQLWATSQQLNKTKQTARHQ